MPTGRKQEMKSEPIEIRAFRPGDEDSVNLCIAQLQEYERAIDNRVLPGDAVRGWYLDYLQKQCAVQDGTIFVALVSGCVVGFAAVQAKVRCEDEDEEDYEFAYISDVGVNVAHRGRGIGRALIAKCEAFARSKGARWLRNAVLGRNAPARGLYESHGFEDRQVLMEKALST